ncbi:tRNA lysidine(34) synthetase TilS [Roseomonas sp. WA12]
MIEPAFDAAMAELGPFGTAPVLAIGVSGGPHSLALAVLASNWAKARGGRVLGFVADHGLRAGSDGEAAGVAVRLRALGIPALVLGLGLARGPGMHERARAARFGALVQASEAAGAPWLLLGHHRADQAETVVFRALRGSGDAGLAGMAAARPAGGVMVLRPLLGVSPGAIEDFLAAQALAAVRDPSNTDPRFVRARLRAVLGDPRGKGAGVAALAAAGEAFAVRQMRLREAVALRLARAARFKDGGWARLDRETLGTDVVAEAALSGLLRAVGGGVHPPGRASVRAMLLRGGGSLGGALWRGGLVCREPARCAEAVPACPGVLWDDRWLVRWAPERSWIGARGPGAARGDVPALVAAGMPVLRDEGGRPIESGATEGGDWAEFRPVSGPIA